MVAVVVSVPFEPSELAWNIQPSMARELVGEPTCCTNEANSAACLPDEVCFAERETLTAQLEVSIDSGGPIGFAF